jgi:superfamily II RNA helicase
MSYPLQPESGNTDPDLLLEAFLEYVEKQGISLYPAQEEAILEVFAGKNIILNTPTGSGKSLVAAAMHYYSASLGRKSVYTCPIKALVNEKFLALCRDFGPESVGMMTGDATVNRDAPILCCTAEILANLAARDGEKAEIHDVIMDEFHYYSDQERGVAWQVPLLTLPQCRFMLMSATMGETHAFAKILEDKTHQECVVVSSQKRPVPLEFEYWERTLPESVEELQRLNQLPVYIVHFTQRSASETAQNLLSINVSSKEEKRDIDEALMDVKFSSPFGKELRKLLRHGIGLHHAGLLPKYRVLVEKLAQRGMLKLICGTDTLGVGVNVPIRTVLFTQLSKYGGSKTSILSSRDFHQISGRAGRKGYDDIGYVVSLAPEHIVLNKRLEQKAANDPKKKKKIVKKRPPERGYVGWDEQTFLRLQKSKPEPLASRFQVSHALLLNVLSREGDGCGAMRQIIRDCHDTEAEKSRHRKRAFQLFRSLVERSIVEINEGNEDAQKLRINVELQDDFSLNQTLALYCVDTLSLLDPQDEDYALKVLSLAESILEDPDFILRKQLDKLKTDKMAEMKAEGIEYEERMERLDEMEHPKPERDFIYQTYNEFAHSHPWVDGVNIRPKSIAREMYESFSRFGV